MIGIKRSTDQYSATILFDEQRSELLRSVDFAAVVKLRRVVVVDVVITAQSNPIQALF